MKTECYPKCRRRNFFIKRHLQARFIGGFTFLVLAGMVLNLLLAYYLIDSKLTEEIYKIHLTVRSTSELVWPVLWKLSLLAASIGFFVAAAIGYHLTRGVEAPVRDFAGNIRKAADADFSRMSVMAEFNGLDDLRVFYNRMAHSLESRFCAVRDVAIEMEIGCEKVVGITASRGLTGAEVEALKKELAHIEDLRARARRELEHFRV